MEDQETNYSSKQQTQQADSQRMELLTVTEETNSKILLEKLMKNLSNSKIKVVQDSPSQEMSNTQAE